jgi:hypothetical protein
LTWAQAPEEHRLQVQAKPAEQSGDDYMRDGRSTAAHDPWPKHRFDSGSFVSTLTLIAVLWMTVARGWAADAPGQAKLVLLPPEFQLYNITPSEANVVNNEAESDQVRQALVAAVMAYFQKRPGMDIKGPDALGSATVEPVSQWTLLASAAMRNVWNATEAHSAEWDARLRPLNVAIGPALAPLGARIGATAAVVISGENYYEPRFARVLGNIAAAAAPPNHRRVSPGGAVLIGLVDLATGQLLWMGGTTDAAKLTPGHPEEAARIVQQVFKDYPAGQWVRQESVFP